MKTIIYAHPHQMPTADALRDELGDGASVRNLKFYRGETERCDIVLLPSLSERPAEAYSAKGVEVDTYEIPEPTDQDAPTETDPPVPDPEPTDGNAPELTTPPVADTPEPTDTDAPAVDAAPVAEAEATDQEETAETPPVETPAPSGNRRRKRRASA